MLSFEILIFDKNLRSSFNIAFSSSNFQVQSINALYSLDIFGKDLKP